MKHYILSKVATYLNNFCCIYSITRIANNTIKIEFENKKIFYFDKDNSHKELKKLIEHFEEKGYSVYMREVKYGLDENEYIYEVHIIA